MIVACYADDPKEPELIGETVVDLTEVLSKGETDGGPHTQFSEGVGWLTVLGRRMVHPYEQGQVQWRGISGVDILVKRSFPALSGFSRILTSSVRCRKNHRRKRESRGS